jgi:hypothetical protein
MKRLILSMLATFGLSVGLLVAIATPSQADSGDKVHGCTSGAGCTMTIWTDKCTNGTDFWWGVFDELGSSYTQWVGVSPGCTVRTRQRMVNSAGTGFYNSAWVTSSPKSSYYSTTHSNFQAKKNCFSEWSVRRKDGSWYTRYHYSSKYQSSATFRDICTDA